MLRPAAIISLGLLAACATPREQCLEAASRDARVLSALIAQSEATLARGYALEREQRLYNTLRACNDEDRAGDGFNNFCRGVRASTVTVPVAVDLDAEREKLDQLRERLAAITPATQANLDTCRARYPEG